MKMRVCYVCGKSGSMHKHHIIHKHGRRRAYETRESLVDICFDCHQLVHSTVGSNLDKSLKLKLQDIYFNKGYDHENVCRLMGGKLISPRQE